MTQERLDAILALVREGLVKVDDPVGRAYLERIGRAIGAEGEASPMSPSSPAPLRILLAEDGAESRALLTGVLERRGHTVIQAGNGREVLTECIRNECDVICMAVALPVMDGMAALRAIRESSTPRVRADVPVVALAAPQGSWSREAILEAGADTVLELPVDADGLVRACLDAVAGRSGVPVAVGADGIVAGSRDEEVDILADNATLARDFSLEPEDVVALLEALVGEIPGMIDRMESALRQSDWEELAVGAHSLAGSSMQFLSPGVSELARTVERLALDHDTGGLRAAVPPLAETVRRCLDAARKRLVREGGGS